MQIAKKQLQLATGMPTVQGWQGKSPNATSFYKTRRRARHQAAAITTHGKAANATYQVPVRMLPRLDASLLKRLPRLRLPRLNTSATDQRENTSRTMRATRRLRGGTHAHDSFLSACAK